MKKVITLIAALLMGTAASAQILEPHLGVNIKHSEGFTVPRFGASMLDMYKGIGVYSTFEMRNNVTFSDDANGDGNYFRYLMGPTIKISKPMYLFAGLSPFGKFGFNNDLGSDGFFDKVRKEVGAAYIYKGIALRITYSNWVGLGTTLGYQIPLNGPLKSYKDKKQKVPHTPQEFKVALVEEVKVVIVDTAKTVEVVVVEEPKTIEPVMEPKPVFDLEHWPLDGVAATVYFNFNDYRIKPSERIKLEEAVSYLNRYAELQIVIVGHADPIGTDAVNDQIGRARALSVKNELLNKYSIAESRIEVISKGESEAYSEDNALNRRVLVILLK